MELYEGQFREISRRYAMHRLLKAYIEDDYGIAEDLLKAQGESDEDISLIVKFLQELKD